MVPIMTMAIQCRQWWSIGVNGDPLATMVSLALGLGLWVRISTIVAIGTIVTIVTISTIIVIGSNGAISTIVTKGAIVAVDRQLITIVAIKLPLSPLWQMAQMSLVIPASTLPFNGAIVAINMAPIVTNGDHQWRQWRSPIAPMVVRCTIGAIIGIAIGDNGSPLFSPLTPMARCPNLNSLWLYYPNNNITCHKKFCI